MGEVWIPEAENLRPAGTAGTMSGRGPARAIPHVTVSPSGISSKGTVWFDRMHQVLIAKKAEPHLLYDPVTDRLGQYFPLNRSARALMNGGKEISHNKVGEVCIQIEFVAQPDGFTRYWKPGPNFRAMMRAIRSWGIPDQFIARPAKSYGDDVRASWSTYKTRGGWFGHCHVPDPETHWDPGPIDVAAFFAAAPITAPTLEDDMFEDADRILLKQAKQEANYAHIHAKAAAMALASQQGDDVDEKLVVALITPVIVDVVKAAVTEIGQADPDKIADSVVNKIGAALAATPPAT